MLVPASDYSDLEIEGTLAALGPWWIELVKGLDSTPVTELAIDGVALLGGDLTRSEAERVIDRSLVLLQRAARALAESGQFGSGQGTVHGLFTSGGGVPKLPVDAVEVDGRGVVGDVQKTKKHHGRPWQALCLWSKEKVDLLQAEGHPISYGSAGENISITGIAWEDIRPGVRLQIGDVLAECSLYSLPCAKNRRWFADRDSMRMHHETELGISRMYASVLEPGHICAGDSVILEP
ncbi:MAG: MOSC domain-containing protein [Acidimicrobiia bacterium]|nr:MOSC domain-containing protein [Acidimicrobiia bacterium]